jgi:hypothetical protein
MSELYLSHLALRYEVMHELSLGAKTPSLTGPFKVWRPTPSRSHKVRAFVKK